MGTKEILGEVNRIFADVLDDGNIVINEKTTANDVEGWDSLTHIQLVVAIEKHFKVRFTSLELQTFANVGEMCESIKTKLRRS